MSLQHTSYIPRKTNITLVPRLTSQGNSSQHYTVKGLNPGETVDRVVRVVLKRTVVGDSD